MFMYTARSNRNCGNIICALTKEDIFDWTGANKAGRLVGKADCYAVVAIADNTTFSLAVNHIAAF